MRGGNSLSSWVCWLRTCYCNRVLEDNRDACEKIESPELEQDWLRDVRKRLATDSPAGWGCSWKTPFHRFYSSSDFWRGKSAPEWMCPVLEFLGSFVILACDPLGALFCH